jgi:hypothetical protein
MKKQFNNLLYTGLMLIGLPFFVLIILIILPIISEKNNTDIKVEDHVKIYDTVSVKKVIKIYDTITVEKIKWIEKVKTDTIN